MADKFFEVNGLNVKYGDIQVLWDINFHVEKGEIIAIVGSNGAGKSTTVKTCAGLIKPESGSIKIGGEEVAKGTCRQLIDHGIILIPEGRQLFPGMTIYENLEMGISSAEAKKMKKDTIEQIFTWFPKLKERKNQLAGTLSGGEQQMVAFSRGMMGRPKLLMMDEPSLGLAPNVVDNIFSIAQQIAKDSGLSIILVEQDVRKALKLANRGYVLENGRITLEGESEKLRNDPEVKKAYLGF